MPQWISPWGMAALLLAAMGLLLIYVTGVRLVTLSASALGLAVVFLGVIVRWGKHRSEDRAWLASAAVVNGTVLLLALFYPGILNPIWAMDVPVPVADPHLQLVVPRSEPFGKGRLTAEGEWPDAAEEVIRQREMVIRIESAKPGSVASRSGQKVLLVHLRLGNASHVETVPFAGFDNGKHQPVLKDAAGKSYAFLEQQPRKLGVGPPHVFMSVPLEAAQLYPTRHLDYQLVFELPPADFGTLHLELPAAAWGRQGVCRLRISKWFEVSF